MARRTSLGRVRGYPLRARLGSSMAPFPAPACAWRIADHVAMASLNGWLSRARPRWPVGLPSTASRVSPFVPVHHELPITQPWALRIAPGNVPATRNRWRSALFMRDAQGTPPSGGKPSDSPILRGKLEFASHRSSAIDPGISWIEDRRSSAVLEANRPLQAVVRGSCLFTRSSGIPARAQPRGPRARGSLEC